MSEPQNIDIFERQLQEELAKLKQCQESKKVESNATPSCYNCENLIECEIRKSYVSAVYKSMNKGEASDFDF